MGSGAIQNELGVGDPVVKQRQMQQPARRVPNGIEFSLFSDKFSTLVGMETKFFLTLCSMSHVMILCCRLSFLPVLLHIHSQLLTSPRFTFHFLFAFPLELV
jgi:hypothetical protein